MSSAFARGFALSFLSVAALLAAVGALAITLIAPVPLEMFRTSKFEMRLAEGWVCEQQGSTYTCNTSSPPWDARGVLAMKRRGSMDSLEDYRAHLSKPRTWPDRESKLHTSDVRSLGVVRLGGRDWISAVHFESELVDFFTTYMVTVTLDAGIAVTFSSSKRTYDRRREEFERMIDSLTVYQL